MRSREGTGIAIELHYRSGIYRIEDGHWRGPDGHVVHLLTWVTDDLRRSGELAAVAGDDDLEAAQQVAERLGEARVEVGGGGRR